jgi:hypothetical protein
MNNYLFNLNNKVHMQLLTNLFQIIIVALFLPLHDGNCNIGSSTKKEDIMTKMILDNIILITVIDQICC